MKNLKLLLCIAIIALHITSCSDSEKIETLEVESNLIENLYAPVTTDYVTLTESGDFVRFSFAEGTTVIHDNWDIAFRGTTVLVNGGEAYGYTDEPERTATAELSFETGTFAQITTASEDENFSQDALGELALPKSTWYSYDPTTHLINAIAGKVLVVKTHNGHYAKLEFLSYYKDYDTSVAENSRYYSFNYTYNPNEGDKNLE